MFKDNPTFDPDFLRNKYREERDKRLNTAGIKQYLEIKENLSFLKDHDPYQKVLPRDLIKDKYEVLIIGAGFGGILTAISLKKKGFENILIIDSAGDFGGTWYWNRYPGAQCDIESYIYLPLLEEVGFIPKEKYSFGPEILEYIKLLASKYSLYKNALFHTEVNSIEFDEDRSFWNVSTNRDDLIKAQYVCSSIGLLNKPKLPGVKGFDKFSGHCFHTSRWDYSYTGGSSNGSLNKLKDKKVAIIGTGATAVQCIPHLAETSKELFVFQRTPSSIDVRGNQDTDINWIKGLDPGWHKERRDNFNILVSGGHQEKDLVNDGWTSIMKKLGAVLSDPSNLDEYKDLSPKELDELIQYADFEKMEEIRNRVDAIVEEGSTAEKLKPYYRQFCKRPCFHDQYLQAFNKENVSLVDTNGKGIEEINHRGVMFNGETFEVDCIIFATGFEVGTDYSRRAECSIKGKNSITLEEKWSSGVKTLHGFQTEGFPNLFFIGLIQGGLTANNTHMLTEQADHISYLIHYANQIGAKTAEISKDAENKWVEEMKNSALDNEDFLSSCTPGYYNDEGKSEINGLFSLQYGGGPVKFFETLENWRKNKFLRDVNFK